MSGDTIETAVTGAFLAFGGLGFARLGWLGVRRPAPEPEPGRELAAQAAARSSPAWKLLWLFCLLFGAFILACGLILMVGPFLPETHA
jgi:hypothetical protein